IRTASLFGLSDVLIQFTYDFTYEEAEQKVINRLAQLPTLPGGVLPRVSNESPIGGENRNPFDGPVGFTFTDFKTTRDWILVRRFKAVPGVVDVTSWGGRDKTFDLAIDQDRLVSYGLTIPQVLQALQNANINVGGNTINFGPQMATVRGIGLIHSMEDVRN